MADLTNPFSPTRGMFADEEIQVCFGAAIGCGLFGFLGVALESFVALSTPLSAFLMAGLVYSIAGFVRVVQLQKDAPGEIVNSNTECELERQVARSAA